MIHITQLIYLKEGQEETFDVFEAIAIPTIAKYGGTLLLRSRLTGQNFIEGSIEQPYEIHLVSFDNEDQLKAFFQDEERKQVVHLKDQSIREVWLIQGERIA